MMKWNKKGDLKGVDKKICRLDTGLVEPEKEREYYADESRPPNNWDDTDNYAQGYGDRQFAGGNALGQTFPDNFANSEMHKFCRLSIHFSPTAGGASKS